MKKIISLLLTLSLSASLLLTCAAGAYNKKQLDQADALNHLGLFLGTGQGYELDARLDRSQSITLILRMLGEIAEAEKGGYTHPFTDVPGWADKYVAYAYEKGYVKGYSATTFGGTDQVSDFQYLTMVLRAMGYSDSGETPDFDYRKSAVLAKELGLVSSADDDTDFVRGNAVEIFWNAMSTKLKNSDETLSERLIAQKVFTQAQFNTASSYAKNGKPSSGGMSSGGTTSGGTTSGGTTSGGTTSGGTTSGGTTSGGTTSGGTTSGGTTSGGTTDDTKPKTLTWEEYNALSGEKQYAYFQSFSDPKDFFAWQEKAKADYEKRHPTIEVGKDGTVDIGDLINGNN